MALYTLTKVEDFDASGGPYIERPAERATHTRSGRYIISVIEKHISQRWRFSCVAWGTPIKLENNIIKVNKSGSWKNLSSFSGFTRYRNNEPGLTKMILEIYGGYKQTLMDLGKLPASEQVKKLPATWIFNDFGHITIKYFNDLNHNQKEDKGERVSDFIHTIPEDEFYTSFGMHMRQLPSSHGCIHIHPKDIDRMIAAYAKVGTNIVVHDYKQTAVPVTLQSKIAVPPYELHFFPYVKPVGQNEVAGKLAIYSVIKMQ